MFLASRAKALAQVRSFFEERHILEVDCMHLSPYPAIDPYIDVIKAEEGYLHTSPEYAMKKLLAKGSCDIYFLGHVYRKEEKGSLHNPEFTMIEYYRVKKSLQFLIEEVIELCRLFVPECEVSSITYDDAYTKYAKPIDTPNLSEQEAMHLTWATHVEPHFKGLTVVTDFPASEAALAKIINGKAQRFEIYYNGIELANGYNELNDSAEQRERLEKANHKNHPIDEEFVDCLDHLPECVGVAIGFDRLLQIKCKVNSIHSVLPNHL